MLMIRSSSLGGLGLFAGEAIQPLTYLATYCGDRRSSESLAQIADHNVLRRKLAYAISLPDAWHHGAVLLLDPTDELGQLQERYRECGALRINEPPMDQLPNAIIVMHEPSHTLQVWSVCSIAAGSEITMFYGTCMHRSILLVQRRCTRR